MKKEVIQIIVEPELKRKIQQLADADMRKLSDFIRVQLIKLVEEQGKKK